MRRSLNAPQRPSQSPQRDDLLFLFFAQDIAHLTKRNSPPVQCPDSAISLAGFQVSTNGRFWVSPEDPKAKSRAMDLSDVKGHMVRVFNHMREQIGDLPVGQKEPDVPQATFAFG